MSAVVRRLALALAVLLLAPACAPSPRAPSRPIAQEQVIGPAGVDVAAARYAALSFVLAYADSPTRGVGALRDLIAGPDLRSWVRWLGVQDHEFDGSIDGAVDLRSAAFVGSVPIRTAVGAQVQMSASVTFSFAPSNGQPFERTRILDGAITLIRTGTADWRIVDVTRDGVSIDAGITRFDGQVQRAGGAQVRLDSVFRFQPSWQFNLVVTNGTRQTIGLDPAAAALLVKRPGDAAQAVQVVATASLLEIPAGGTAEGLVAVPFQDSARGRVLSLPFVASNGTRLRFAFPLAGLIDPLPGPATGVGSSAPVPS